MPHEVRKKGVLAGSALAVFLALVHTVNDAITAILGALLPTLQARFDASPTTLALIVAVFWIASSVTQPLLGSLAEDVGLRAVAALGVLGSALFLSLVGVAPELWILFLLLIVGGLGSAALHPVGTTISAAASQGNRTLGVGLFTAGGMIGFALGPVLILYLVSNHGTGATVWLMVPGLILAAAVYLLLPDWQPHGRRRLGAMLDRQLVFGPVGALALAGSFTSVAFVTFTSTLPLWLVQEHGYDTDAALIGLTLAVFSLSAGAGSLLGGLLAPRIGRRQTVVGALSLASVPLAIVVLSSPGSATFFVASAAAGLLLFTPSSVKVVIAQELAPHSPASASGMILGMTSAVAGTLYIALGRLQQTIGLDAGMVVGFSMVIPAAALTAIVLGRFAEETGSSRG
jgi:FSR family fosmidomycin resistance protein-like MFS transporter